MAKRRVVSDEVWGGVEEVTADALPVRVRNRSSKYTALAERLLSLTKRKTKAERDGALKVPETVATPTNLRGGLRNHVPEGYKLRVQ